MQPMTVSWWWLVILREHDTEPTEMIGGGAMIGFGILLLFPGAVLATSPAYAVLALLPEWLTGVCLLGLGIGKWAALRAGSVCWRRRTSGAAFLIWFLLCVSFLTAPGGIIGAGLFLTAAGSACWAYVRTGRLPR